MKSELYITIGSKSGALTGKPGRYAVQFMGVTLIYDNGSSAVQAYNNIQGEAYIWDISQRKRVVLVEAKIIKAYYLHP